MSEVTIITKQLKQIIEESSVIYIACHSSPDPDALGSLIAVSDILRNNFGKSNISIFAETLSHSLGFLPGYEMVNSQGIYSQLLHSTPDLIIFVDFNMWHMLSPKNAFAIKDIVTSRNIKTVVIDHHPQEIKNIETTLYINREDSSTAQTLFRLFGDELQLQLTQLACDNLLAGIISDTERFKYNHSSLPYTFSILPKIIETASFDIETLTQTMTRFPQSSLRALRVFLENTVVQENGLTYTQIKDNDITKYALNKTEISAAAKFFMSHLLLNVEDTLYGFVLYPYMKDSGMYTVSLRSTSSKYSVKTVAESLGGGGHEKASAVRVKALNSEEALATVLAQFQGIL